MREFRGNPLRAAAASSASGRSSLCRKESSVPVSTRRGNLAGRAGR
jgi:hypothetical protein